jgi:protein-disulfide isomerase
MSAGSRRAQEAARQQAAAAAKRQRERRMGILAALVVLVLLVGGGIAFQAWRTNRAPDAAPASGAASLTPVAITDGKPIVLGQGDASVKLGLYEDFHCPHCAEFEEAYGPVLSAARQSGKAAIELYPMSFIDAGSESAANAMACAAEAGFGPAYYEGLFANATLRWSDDQLIALANQVAPGHTERFSSCVTSRAHAGWVASINATADANGVSSTPTLFLDDARLDLANLTPEALQTRIDEAATT